MTLKGTERLPKSARLLKRTEFLKLSRTGAKLQLANFIVISRANHHAESRLGITVSGKVGNAVIRNRIKRQVREFFRRRRGTVQPGPEILVIARKSPAGLPGPFNESELGRVLSHQSPRRRA